MGEANENKQIVGLNVRALFADSGNQIRSKVVGSWLGVAVSGSKQHKSVQLEEGIRILITRVRSSYRKIEG